MQSAGIALVTVCLESIGPWERLERLLAFYEIFITKGILGLKVGNDLSSIEK